MSVRVQLPPLLRAFSGGERSLAGEGETIAAIMGDIARRHPAFGRHLFDEAGHLRPSIVFLHQGELIRAGEAATRAVSPGDEIVLTNALSGGLARI